MSLSIEILREMLSYDAATGDFTGRIVTRNGKGGPGCRAGGPNNQGYWHISIDGRRYKCHRLAWLHVFGQWPKGSLDHINNNPADNRIANLRIATRGQNAANSRLRWTNSSGFKGITRQKGLWRAQIRSGGRAYRLGLFRSPEEAHAAYCSAAQELFGEFWRAE